MTFTFEIAVYCNEDGNISSVGEKLKQLEEMKKNNVLLSSKIFRYYKLASRQNQLSEISLLHMERWENWLEQGNGNQILYELSHLMERQKEGQISAQQLMEIHNNFTKAFYCAIGRTNTKVNEFFSDEFAYEDFLDSSNNFHMMIDAVRYVCSHFMSGGENSMENQTDKAIQYIRDHIDKSISRGEIADYVFLSAEYLSRLFKKKTGFSLKDFIINEKIESAKYLLETTNLSVTIIASKVGYQNSSHFSNVFKRIVNISPYEYRQEHQK